MAGPRLSVLDANVTVKNIKCIGRGYRSHENYQCHIMLYHAARMAA